MQSLDRPDRTFCDLPFAGPSEFAAADVVILGASHGTPYKPGTPSHAANGHVAVRGALGWYSANPEQYDFDSGTDLHGGATAIDGGNVPGDLEDGGLNRRRIHEATTAVLEAGAVPVFLGGDDSIPIPVIEAYEGRGPVAVVQVDAHIDWRDEINGVTHGFSSTMRRASEMAHVEQIVQIGARGPGSARAQELADARAWGARFFTARDIYAHGIWAALAAIPADMDVFLSIDVDGIDPSIMPGVILPAFGGVTYQQMLDVIHETAKKSRIVGAAFVEYVPEKDPHGTGAQLIARLVSNVISAVGQQRKP